MHDTTQQGQSQAAAVALFQKVVRDVTTERSRQDAKWGEQNHDFPHYYQILNEELGEASNSYLEAGYAERSGDPEIAIANRANLRTELVQSAAVLLAMIEAGDRNGWWPKS